MTFGYRFYRRAPKRGDGWMLRINAVSLWNKFSEGDPGWCEGRRILILNLLEITHGEYRACLGLTWFTPRKAIYPGLLGEPWTLDFRILFCSFWISGSRSPKVRE